MIAVDDFPVVEDKVLKKFSNDAKDLYRLCIAVTTGMCPDNIITYDVNLSSDTFWQLRV